MTATTLRQASPRPPARIAEASARPKPGLVFVENDGMSVLLPASVPYASSVAERRAAFARVAASVELGFGNGYLSEKGMRQIGLRIRPDIVVSLRKEPPRITAKLEQAAVDAILELGSTPETRPIDRAVRDFTALTKIAGEMRDVADRQASHGHVDRRMTLDEAEAVACRPGIPSARAAALLAAMPASETRTRKGAASVPAGSVERAKITALCLEIAREVDAEVDARASDLNDMIERAFLARVEAMEAEIEPRYRMAFARAKATLKDSSQSRRLMLPPLLTLEESGLVLVMRPYMIALVVRYAGFQARMDVDVPHADLRRILERRTSPLWFRVYDPGGLPSWQRASLMRRGIIPGRRQDDAATAP